MRRFILMLSIAGFLLFSSAMVVSIFSPRLIESGLREVIRMEVERETGEKIEVLLDSRIASAAQRMLGKTDESITQARAELPSRVAIVVDYMLQPDCECRRRLDTAVQTAQVERLATLGDIRQRLVVLIESAYSTVTASLLREFRIFTGANALAFAGLGVVALVRPRSTLQLLLPAVALLAAVIVTSGLYLFQQNWLHTVIYNEYVGLAYLAYLAGVALLFADMLLNRARMTTHAVKLILALVGACAAAIGC